MNLIALVEVVDLVLSYLDSSWRRCARMIGSRNLNVAYILVLVVVSSWLLLASLTRIPRIISLQPCHGPIHTTNGEFPVGKFNIERSKLYEQMAAELDEKGPAFLGHGETSQSLKLSDLFEVKKGKIIPVHKEVDPPVRATVLYLDPDYATQILKATWPAACSKEWLNGEGHFVFSLATGVWYQDPNLYHFSMHHASHHSNPVPATLEEVEVEANAVKQVAEQSCQIGIELERVVLTPAGVLLGCWQVLKGTEPSLLREELRKALPRSPAKQMYNPAIFYTSLARLLGPPVSSSKENSGEEVLDILKDLVLRLNKKICSKAVIKELWYVEELDILALALKGRTRRHRFPLHQCTPSKAALK